MKKDILCPECGSSDIFVKNWIISETSSRKVPYIFCYRCRDKNILFNWNSKKESREQKLVDIMFEVLIRYQMGDIGFSNREEAADWLATQLKASGFDGGPVGSSWFVLKD